MRELTPEEIKNAPEWAVEYYIDIKDIWYVNKKWGMAKMIGRVRNIKSHSQIMSDAKPIPRKEFDISENEFSDCDIESVEIDGYADNEYLHFDFKQETNELTHCKDDVIAMAKALKLTAEDLR